MGDITTNFSYRELKPNHAPDTWRATFKLQDLMLKELAKNLQILRDKTTFALHVNSGVRTYEDIARLRAAGYNPSSISDHCCGNIIPIEPSNPKYQIFGPYYMFAVGAADITPSYGIDATFKMAIDLNKQGITDFGQIIHESDSVKKTNWIHFSNNPSKFFTANVCSIIQKPKYMTSIDGGKTYNEFVG